MGGEEVLLIFYVACREEEYVIFLSLWKMHNTVKYSECCYAVTAVSCFMFNISC